MLTRTLAASLVLLCCTTLSASAQHSDPMTEGPAPVSVVVRAQAKGETASLQPGDIKVEFNGKAVPVASLQQLGGRGSTAHLEIALLIDDGLRSNFGTQIHEVENFVSSTAGPNVALGVGYMRNGAAYFPVGFSTEPEQELKAIRLPISSAGVDGSPYFCLQDLLKKWPQHPNTARVVIMITNGIDRYNGSTRPDNQNSPYVAQAVTDAQRAGVPVYSIFYARRDIAANIPSFSGQSYLSQMAEGTGGDTYNSGTIAPPSIEPFFREFQTAMRESYLLTFQTGSQKQERLKVTAPKGVKIRVQPQAGVPGSK